MIQGMGHPLPPPPKGQAGRAGAGQPGEENTLGRLDSDFSVSKEGL